MNLVNIFFEQFRFRRSAYILKNTMNSQLYNYSTHLYSSKPSLFTLFRVQHYVNCIIAGQLIS